MASRNKILTALNAALKVTNLFGAGRIGTVSNPLGEDTMEGLPLGTSDGTPTGELAVKVLLSGGSITIVPEVLTDFRNQAINSTAVSVQASAGKIMRLYCINTNAYPIFLKFYNVAVGSVVVGTTVPVLTVPVPASGYMILEYNGFPYRIFSTAISVAAVQGSADSDATALATAVQLQLGIGA